jgi:hypothetical protein
LGEAVTKTVAAHHGCVRTGLAAARDAISPAQQDSPASTVPPSAAAVEESGSEDSAGGSQRELLIVTRTRQRFTDVRKLCAEGASLSAISRSLHLDRDTVRRFARADSIDELLVKAINRTSLLDGFTAHLTARLATGISDAVVLHREIRGQGYTGSIQTVRRYLHPLRQATASELAQATTQPVVPKPRTIIRWIMTENGRLGTDDQAQLAAVLTCCPELHATAGHVRAFAQMMAQRHGHQLADWMRAVDGDDLPALHSLVVGLRRDLAAVTAGLTMPWSSGAVEGNVNRIKTLKRQMYGRASFALLRKRILLTA